MPICTGGEHDLNLAEPGAWLRGLNVTLEEQDVQLLERLKEGLQQYNVGTAQHSMQGCCTSRCSRPGPCVRAQVGDVAAASRSYERAVALAGRNAPGVFRLMAELARRSASSGAAGGVVADLRANLPPIEELAPQRVDELEDAAAGILLIFASTLICPSCAG